MINKKIIFSQFFLIKIRPKEGNPPFERGVKKLKSLPDVNMDRRREEQREGQEEERRKEIKNFKTFLDNYYSLPDTFTETIDLNNFPRALWYCNISGVLIPELQTKYSDLEIDLQDLEPEQSLASDFYQGKLTEVAYNKYRVFPCGHCILDVYYLSSLYDNMNFNWSPPFTIEKVEKCIQRLLEKCPICDTNVYDPDKVYLVSNRLTLGTVILKSIIPLKYLKYLSSIFEPGKVIDTDGYRGIGLYLLDDDQQFKKIPIENYYPIWSLKWLKKKGYAAYVNLTDFDALPFENGIYLTMERVFYNACNSKVFELNSDEELQTEENDYVSPETTCAPRNYQEKINLQEAAEMTYPFEHSRRVNEYLKSGKLFKARLNEFEYLVFEKTYPYVTNFEGEITALLFY